MKKVSEKGLSERLLGKKELAEETGLTVRYIETAMKNYSLPYFKIGKMIKFKISDFEQWLQKRRKVAS